MPKHTLYFSDSMYEKLDVDKLGVEGLSNRVSNLCSIALETMRDAVPVLSESEWMALMDCSNGYMRNNEYTIAQAARQFFSNVAACGMEYDDKWDVSCVELARKINDMDLPAQCAVMEICRRFWVRGDITSKFSKMRDALEALGARIS